MAIGDEEPAAGIEFVDWTELFARTEGDETILPGLAFRGRWTAIVAAAKEGKSTVLLGLAVGLARSGVKVMYLDAEMGRADVLDRVEEWMQLKPDDLANIYYSDLLPKLNTVEGAAQLEATVVALMPDIIIIDGLNGVVTGAEKDDTPWRDLYEWAVAPCKALNIAVVSADNTGKDKTLGPRGSSVKLDKADAVILLERTDAGCKMTATHRRTSAYPVVQNYVVAHASEEGPPMTVTPVAMSDPAGTIDVVRLLDDLGASDDIGIVAARKLVRAHGYQGRNTTIDAATRTRKTRVPDFGAQFRESPASRGAPNGGSSVATPALLPGAAEEGDADEWDPFA